MKNLRTVVFLGLGAMLAVATYVLWQGRVDAMPDPTPPRPPPSSPSSAAPERGDAIRGGEPDTAPANERTVADGAPAVAQRRVHGTITAVDSRGVEHAATSGTMELDVGRATAPGRKPPPTETVRTKVTAGRWEALVPADAVVFVVNEVELDGHSCTTEDTTTLTADDPEIALRVRWFDSLRLRVRASDTGADLTGVRVVQMTHWELDDCPNPGNSGIVTLLEHAASPLLVPVTSRADTQRVWVRAEGYAWNSVNLVTAEAGERELRLVPGGDVEVLVAGTPPEGAVLRVRDDGRSGSPYAEFTRSGARTRIEGLPVGRWSLTLEKGKWFQDPLGLGATTVEITRGALATASITVASVAERPPTVQVQGTLQIDSAWGADVALQLEPLRTLAAWTEATIDLAGGSLVKVDASTYRWGPLQTLAGRYGVEVRAAGYRAVVEVGPGPMTDLTIVVPPPNEVRIRLLDAMSGTPLTGTSPSWYAKPPEGWDLGWGHSSTTEVGDGWYRFMASAGAIEINTQPEGYAWTLAAHDVMPGPNEFLVRVQRIAGVDVVLKDGDVIVPLPNNAMVNIENVVTKAGVAYWSGSKVAAKEPGEHTLTITPIEGYEPIPARKVMVTAGEWTKVEIELKRKP